ncbi:hypothetical protein DPMN_093170 [Dreissena polymorpha]|uniref:Uncharacterized protein n=1 Tax=Dreissena polymorpha TaxID=45954 RepID=A0A9D4R1L6_DREPO|nr:hypothetical protein DPMN_093170 [Dreissena polymorpha]
MNVPYHHIVGSRGQKSVTKTVKSGGRGDERFVGLSKKGNSTSTMSIIVLLRKRYRRKISSSDRTSSGFNLS